MTRRILTGGNLIVLAIKIACKTDTLAFSVGNNGGVGNKRKIVAFLETVQGYFKSARIAKGGKPSSSKTQSDKVVAQHGENIGANESTSTIE